MAKLGPNAHPHPNNTLIVAKELMMRITTTSSNH